MNTAPTPEDWANLLKELCWQVARLAWALVGLFYKTGYFKQSLNELGWQQEAYPVLDPDGLPLALLREDDGTPTVIEIRLPGSRVLKAHVWRAQVGRVPLLLLDSTWRWLPQQP